MIISVVQLGTVDYSTGLRLQQRLIELRKNNEIANVMLLLEHTPVIERRADDTDTRGLIQEDACCDCRCSTSRRW